MLFFCHRYHSFNRLTVSSVMILTIKEPEASPMKNFKFDFRVANFCPIIKTPNKTYVMIVRIRDIPVPMSESMLTLPLTEYYLKYLVKRR